MEFLKLTDNWLTTGLIYFLIVVTIVLLLRFREVIFRFTGEVRGELAKCTWPWDPEQTGFRRYKVLIESTVIVSVSTLLLATYITGFDFLIGKLVRWLVDF